MINTANKVKNLTLKLASLGFQYDFLKLIQPHKNRKALRSFCGLRSGVYVWAADGGKYTYVGRSLCLYTRIRSYFLPSALKRKDQRVLRYFNKHGFDNVVLYVYALQQKSLERCILLEQIFLTSLKPL
jgi:GIY-YIG catalytic domain